MKCFDCGAQTQRTFEKQELEYGCPVQVVLQVTVPVQTCSACGAQTTDHEAEVIRDKAVADYLTKQEVAP